MFKWIFTYFIAINLFSFITMYIDKKKAIKNKWRISEATLFLLCLLGGSVGIFLGMRTFRHKTKHKKFTIGVPLIIFIQLLLIFIISKSN